MLVLVCLAYHAGRMVPKDRLLHAAWPDTAVGDDVLTRAISELRRLFEDDSKQPRIIETIPKSGYRLIAPVAVEPVQRDTLVVAPPLVEPPGVAVATDRATSLSARRRRRQIAVAASAIGLSILAIGGFWAWRPGRTSLLQEMRVVPLTTLSGSELGANFSPDGRQFAFAWNAAAVRRRRAPVVAGRLGYLRQARRVRRHAAAHVRSRPRSGAGLVARRPGDRVRPRPTHPGGIRARRIRPPNHRLRRSCCPRSGRPTDGTRLLARQPSLRGNHLSLGTASTSSLFRAACRVP